MRIGKPLSQALSSLTLDAGTVRKFANMLKGHAKIPAVDPLTAAGALHEVIGFAFGFPAFGLANNLARFHWRTDARRSFMPFLKV